jgi:hypothetical protein
MARPNIQQVQATGQHSKLFRFDLDLTGIPVLAKVGLDIPKLNLLVETSEIPKKTSQPIEYNLRGHKVKEAGIAVYTNQITVGFIETIRNDVMKLLNNWINLVWSGTQGLTFDPSLYKGIIILKQLDDFDVPIYQWTLKGCYLEDFDPGGTYGGDSNDFRRPQAILSFDWYEDKDLAS